MVDDFYINRLFQIEGGGNPYAPATGSNRGMGQFSPDLEARYGITDQNRTDPAAQSRAVQMEAAEHAPQLARVLGRDPTHGELYLGHQQGVAGASALFSNPDQTAWQAIRPYYKSDNIAKQAIWGNIPDSGGSFNKGMFPGGVENIPASAFMQGWVNKFQGGPAPPPQVASAPASAPSPSLGMLSGANLSQPQPQQQASGPDLGLLSQQWLQAMRPQPIQAPQIQYAIPAALRARLAAMGQG